MWFGPFTLGRIINQDVIEIKPGELSTKKHKSYNVKVIKKYHSFDTEFNFVPTLT